MKTKYSIDQTVYFVWDDKITKAVVLSIKITAADSIHYTLKRCMDSRECYNVREEKIFVTQSDCRHAIEVV